MLDHLLAREVHRHFRKPFLKAWDEQSQNLVCYAVVNHYDRLRDWRLFKQTKAVALAEKCIDMLAGNEHDSEYICGLMCVTGNPNESAWPMGVVRLTAADYAALTEAAS